MHTHLGIQRILTKGLQAVREHGCGYGVAAALKKLTKVANISDGVEAVARAPLLMLAPRYSLFAVLGQRIASDTVRLEDNTPLPFRLCSAIPSAIVATHPGIGIFVFPIFTCMNGLCSLTFQITVISRTCSLCRIYKVRTGSILQRGHL